jgi:hypothetical protein
MKKEFEAGTAAQSSTEADNSTSASVVSKPNVSSRFDLEEQACYNGHITIDAFKCLCGYEYVYYGILSRAERLNYPRASNTYLKYTPLKDVKCEACKKMKYEELRSRSNGC